MLMWIFEGSDVIAGSLVWESFNHSINNLHATASTMGQRKIPRSPWASTPPINPKKITGIGTVVPRLITNGLRMLSNKPTGIIVGGE
jgi:hypothetical protein